jgi:hypothetical protein
MSRSNRPRNDRRGVDLISDGLPFGRLWYAGPNAASNAIDYAKFYSRSHNGVIRVYDDAGNQKAQPELRQAKMAIGNVTIIKRAVATRVDDDSTS